jgi:hypothetical protein
VNEARHPHADERKTGGNAAKKKVGSKRGNIGESCILHVHSIYIFYGEWMIFARAYAVGIREFCRNSVLAWVAQRYRFT